MGQVLAYLKVPVTVISRRCMNANGRTSSSGPIPTRTARPAGPRARIPATIAAGAPEQSMNASKSRQAPGMSEAGSAAVAPLRSAAGRRWAATSLTTIVVAPRARAT